jgi:hypothetical protein
MIFQSFTKTCKSFNDEQFSYDNVYFYCPRVVAKDGFAISLQINNGNYCSSENGYRIFGYTWERVEFGFPSMNEELMFQYSESYCPDSINFDVTNTVGSILVEVLETVFTKHGGIDWEATISIEAMKRLVER